jgi:hypothetical protein
MISCVQKICVCINFQDSEEYKSPKIHLETVYRFPALF